MINLILAVLFAVSVALTARFRFFQLTKINEIYQNTVKTLFEKKKEKRGVSPFKAVSAALAGTMGVGNIAGVATAITAGGAGAVFWMWVSAIFAMILKFIEVTLAQIYRVRTNESSDSSVSTYSGGPMYYIKNGLNKKCMAVIFSVFCILSSFGIGNMSQINTVAEALNSTFGVDKLFVGIAMAITVAFIIIGGIKRILDFTSVVVPVMSVFCIIMSVIILIKQSERLPECFTLIVTSAFSLEKAGAGIFGYTIAKSFRYGISRGIFSNEAGLGSAPIAHAAAETDSPVKQGMWGIFEVFIDTIVVCTLTALAILSTGAAEIAGLDGIALTGEAYYTVFGRTGDIFLTVSVMFFAISSIVCWNFYGERCIHFITAKTTPVLIYKVIFLCVTIAGAVITLDTVWMLSDIFNICMALPNIIAIIFLNGKVLDEVKIRR